MLPDPAAGLPAGLTGPPPSVGPLPPHLLADTARIGPTGRLVVGGIDVLDLCAELGTPVFVYDEEHLRTRCRQAVAAWGSGATYASKAFWCRAMARLVAEEGLAADVSTAGELHVALAGGLPPERLVLHGNNKSEGELAAAIDCGVGRIVVDSFDEIDRLERLLAGGVPGPGGRGRPRALVRVTPGVEAHTHEYVRTGQEDSKFGFGLASGAAAAAVARLRRRHSPVELVGLHIHIGSQIFALDSFARALRLIADFAVPLDLPELSVGGGLGVGYVDGEPTPRIGDWAATVRTVVREAGWPEGIRLAAEPGRAIAASAALTAYTVGTVKELPGIRTYVAVDGGMSDNPRPVLYDSGYEAFLPRVADAERPRVVTIVGKHCESGDVIVRDARLPADVAVGDIVATPVTGAYGHSMASTYNKVPRPPVVWVAGGAARTVVRRETLDDLLALDL